MTKEHPWVMVAIIFTGLVSAGVIIGYMGVNIPTELQQIQDLYQKQLPHQTSALSSYTYIKSEYVGDGKYRDTYSTMYRSVIVFNYSTIPDDAKITWQDLRAES